MRKLALLCLALAMGYAIWAMACAFFVLNAILPIVIAQAAENAIMMMLMLELSVLVITLIALILAVNITPAIVPPGPEWLVFGGGLLNLFGALKELLERSL